MALGSLNLRITERDFDSRIQIIDTRMSTLMDVINRYNDAKTNLDQFMEGNDDNYQAMIDRIDANLLAAKKAHAALSEAKANLEQTVREMNEMSGKVKETISSATEAAKSSINAAIKINAIL